MGLMVKHGKNSEVVLLAAQTSFETEEAGSKKFFFVLSPHGRFAKALLHESIVCSTRGFFASTKSSYATHVCQNLIFSTTLFYFRVLDKLGGKERAMFLLSHEDPGVRYQALMALQKIMVHNW